MAPLSLKVVLDEGAVTRTVMFESTMTAEQAQAIVREKVLVAHGGKEYGLFLTSADDDKAGVWLEAHRNLEYYMLRDGDQLHYLCRVRNLRVRMLDGSEKTLQVDESKTVEQLMIGICARIGITNHDEYGLCYISEEEDKPGPVSGMGTLTLRRHAQQKERDAQLEQLSKKLKTDDHVEWLEPKKTLRELGVDPRSTVLLKRRLFFSDRKVDSRDPVQLNLLYVQARDAMLRGRHPVTEDQAGDCKVRWINIRDVHRRITKKNLKLPTSQKRSYKYDAEMNFMRPFYKDVPKKVLVEESDENAEWDEPDEADEVDEAEDKHEAPQASNESDQEPEPPTVKSSSKKLSRKRKKKNYEEETSFVASTSMDNGANTSEYDTSDPVDAFLLSIGATLKTFSPYHLNLAKSKIFSVVQEHDLQQIVQKSSDVKVPVSDTIYMEKTDYEQSE